MAANENAAVKVVNIDQLAAVIKNKIEKVLIIDSRSFLEFNTCHIINAVNVCCSKIVKRRLQQDKVPVKELLMNTCHVMVNETFEVIVYDQNSYNPQTVSSDSFLSVLLTKLTRAFKEVNLLQGGFLEFQSKYLSLCEDKTRKCVPLTSMSQPCLPISNTGPTRILPFLYLGSQYDAMNKELLNDHNITYELNVSAACPKPDFIPEGHFLRIPVNDNYSEKLLPHFPMAFQFVDKVREASGCVLIHCLAGISRSPTVAIAYIMQYLHMSSDDAYRYVKSKRATISPNFNFLGQLLEYEHQLRKENILKNKSHLNSSSLGHGNKRHCRNAMRGLQKLDLKFSTPSNSSDENSSVNVLDVKKGDQSPTTALSKLSFSNCEQDLSVQNDNQKENVIETNSPAYHSNKSRNSSCVQKSNSATNLRTSFSMCMTSGRRLSFDSGNKLHSNTICQDYLHGDYRSVSFEGLKGIPISSLDNINFTPCQTSGSNFESKWKNGCLEKNLFHSQSNNNFTVETNCCKNVSFNFSMQTQVWHSSKANDPCSGIFKHLNNTIDVSIPYKPLIEVENTLSEKTLSTFIHESSPRPTNILISPLASVQHIDDDDEGIELTTEGDGKPKLETLSRGKQILVNNLESGNLKNTEQVEFLESSYDSGVYPSPTQIVPFVTEFLNSPKQEKADWLNTYEETSSKLTKTFFSDIENNETINLSLHSDNLQKVCNSQIFSDANRTLTPIEKFSLNTTTVFKNKSYHTNTNQKEDRLYRAQSCPGIVGFIHCTSLLDKPGANTNLFSSEIKNSQMRHLQLSPIERETRLRNRYSCDSLDYYNKGKSTSFDSCPDFVNYDNFQNDRNSNNNHEQPSLSAYQSFHQNTGIIQVS